jgi:hypothetical protein
MEGMVMRMMTLLVAALVVLCGTASALDAQARRGGAGLMLGVGAMYTPSFVIRETGDPEALEIGAGFGGAARAGFAFTPAIAVFGAYEHGWHDLAGFEDGQLRHLFGGVRLNLPVLPALAPYVSGGYGRRRFWGRGTSETEEAGLTRVRAELLGDFFDAGGGITVFLARTLTLDVGANLGIGDFDTFRLAGNDLDIDTGSSNVWRIRAGITWLPMTGR